MYIQHTNSFFRGITDNCEHSYPSDDTAVDTESSAVSHPEDQDHDERGNSHYQYNFLAS